MTNESPDPSPPQSVRTFALYEKGFDADTYIRVCTRNTFDSIERIAMGRQRKRLHDSDERIERRVVPARDEDELPLSAENETLSEIVSDNNDLFPSK